MEDPNDNSSKQGTDWKLNNETEIVHLVKRVKSEVIYEDFPDSGHNQNETDRYVSESLANNNVDKEFVQAVKDCFNSNIKNSSDGLLNASAKEDIEPNHKEIDFKSFYIQKDSRTPYSDATNAIHDPEKIKRPMNPFMIFIHYERKKILETKSDLHNAQISKILGKKWKELSMESKLPFKQEAERLRQFHLIEYPYYRYQPRKRIKKNSFLSLMSVTNFSSRSPSKMAKTEKCSLKISDCFGSNSWINSSVSDLCTGSTQPKNPAKLNVKVTIDSSFKASLRNFKSTTAKDTSSVIVPELSKFAKDIPLNIPKKANKYIPTPTSSYYVPGFSSNLYSSPDALDITSLYQVQNFSAFNLPPTPLDVPQQQSDQEWIRDCHQEYPGHQLWDQKQWYLPQFTNRTNLHDELLTKTNSFDEFIQIETLPRVKVDSLPLMEEVVQINTLPSIKEDLNVDLESSTDVFTEVHVHNNEINPSIASFKDDPKIFQKWEKNNEFKTDLEILKEIVPELSKFAKDIPLNILKKANEYIIHEKEKTHCDLMMGDRVVDDDSSIRTFSSESCGEDKAQAGCGEDKAQAGCGEDKAQAGCGEDKAQAGCSNNSLLGINDLSTITNPVSLDAFSKLLNNNSVTIKRRNLTTKQTNHLINAFKTISSMADKLNVSKVITDRANQLFKTVSEGKKLRGHSFDAIAAACMYIACRQEGTPRTFKDIVAVSAVSMKTITKCYKLILKVHDTHVDLITTADFMSRFCQTLSLDKDIEKAAEFIAKAATDHDIVVGKSPRSVAAASIYMASHASGEKKTLCEIADIARVNYTTIRQCYKLMRARANEIFPSHFKFERRIQYLPRT